MSQKLTEQRDKIENPTQTPKTETTTLSRLNLSQPIPLRLIDRTRTVTDWKCPRARFWGYEYLGRGLSKSGQALELFIGITIHDALAFIAKSTQLGDQIDIDHLANAVHKQVYDELMPTDGVILPEAVEFAKEQATLNEGMIRGFYKHVWPRLMADYKIVAVEQEMEYALADDYVFMAKPDLIVEDKDGELVYLEYKTTANKKDNWINSWETAVQLHSSIMATEQTLGRRPSYVRIVGLYKGYESYGKQSSPFCYAYKKSGNPPFTQDQVAYEFKAGFKRYPTWQLDGGVKAWINGMPENVLADQFPLTQPIMVNEDLVNSFFKQRLAREQEIASFYGNEDIDRIFPQKFDQCVPTFGKPCVFKKLCHGNVEDPLNDGFELRTPHHERELNTYDTA
jgi:hypothetical protein